MTAFSPVPPESILTISMRNQSGCILQSSTALRQYLKMLIPVSGNKLYFIASDKDLSTSICQLVGNKNINNIYVGPDYLSDDLLSSKSAEIISLIDPGYQKKQINPADCLFLLSIVEYQQEP